MWNLKWKFEKKIEHQQHQQLQDHIYLISLLPIVDAGVLYETDVVHVRRHKADTSLKVRCKN